MADRPLILITNDDGIGSPLLGALADKLAVDFDVVVVAPERQRSAMSHSITLHKPLRCREVAPGRWSLSGTPVDCVYVGLMRLAPRPPAMIVSGPNDGYNLGSDVFYSGTVAGAVEGGLRGVPAVAVSLAPHAPQPEVALGFVASLVRAALGTLPAGEVLSVNLPGAGETRYAWTALGRRHYVDDVNERADPWGKPYIWIGGGARGHEDRHGSDCNAVADGIISVTPLRLDLNHPERVQTPLFAVDGYARIEP